MVLKGCSKKFEKRVLRGSQESFKGISRKCQGSLKEDWRVFQESFQCVSKVFERSSQGIPEVSKACQGCFKDQGSFRSVPRKLVGCFKEVSMIFQGRLYGD